MADLTIKFKGQPIAELSESGTKTLKTAGKYCEDDITVEYAKPADLPNAEDAYFGTVAGSEYGITSDVTFTSAQETTGTTRYAYTVGMQFTVDTAFAFAGFRYITGDIGIGETIFELWDADTQTVLATRTVTDSTTEWAETRIGSPINLEVGKTYVVSQYGAFFAYVNGASAINSFNTKISNVKSVYNGTFAHSFPSKQRDSWRAIDILIDPVITESVATEYKIQTITLNDIADEVRQITSITETMTTAQIISALQDISVEYPKPAGIEMFSSSSSGWLPEYQVGHASSALEVNTDMFTSSAVTLASLYNTRALPEILQVNTAYTFSYGYNGGHVPQSVSVVLVEDSAASYSEPAIGDSQTTFDITPTAEGRVLFTVTAVFDEENTQTLTYSFPACMELPTYSVDAVEGASYGFNLIDGGRYESQNKGVSSSYALCKVVFDTKGLGLKLDCINYAQANYDYGLLSNLNTELALSNSADGSGVFKNFKGSSKADVQTVDYGTIVAGENFIYVKFIKNGSTNSNNDSLRFKLKFY